MTLGVARSAIPRARDDALVIGDFAVGDVNPMSQRATWRLVEAGAHAIARPAAWVPFGVVLNAIVAPRHIIGETFYPHMHRLDNHFRLDRAGGDPAQRGEQRCRPDAERRQDFVDEFL